MICSKDHVKELSDEALKAIEALPKSQAEPARHVCACCAYQLGVQHGIEQTLRKAEELAKTFGLRSRA